MKSGGVGRLRALAESATYIRRKRFCKGERNRRDVDVDVEGKGGGGKQRRLSEFEGFGKSFFLRDWVAYLGSGSRLRNEITHSKWCALRRRRQRDEDESILSLALGNLSHVARMHGNS